MRILGIDPGLDTTGYGVIEETDSRLSLIEAGLIQTSSKLPIELRLLKIYDGLSSLVDKYKPKKLILEKLYSHYKHPVTSILMGHGRGVICLVSGKKNLELVSYPAKRIKKAITGNGNASKEQVQRMVQRLLDVEDKAIPNDVTDALALAIAHSYIGTKRDDFAYIR
ncbi:MAG: crossover junction endodeoxyribonuclease RuvC [Candidatus Omnitrophota bacterium]